jgi:hypothetical protein
MRHATAVWLGIVALCIVATAYETPNLIRFWPHSVSFLLPGGGQEVPARVAASDPEAADILRHCFGDPNTGRLADLVISYSDNEFFLAQLTERLADVNCVDPGAPLALADALVALNPNNAHYRYLRGWILLNRPWSPSRAREALRQFEAGNASPQFYLPYSIYQERVARLCDRAHLGLPDRSRVRPVETRFYFDLARFFDPLHGPYATLDSDVSSDLLNALADTATRIVDSGKSFRELEDGGFLLGAVESSRLRQLDLPESQAQQARFRLAWRLALSDILQEAYLEVFATGTKFLKAWFFGVVPLLPLLYLPAVWLFLVIVTLLRGGASGGSVGVKGYALFVVGLVGAFGLFPVVRQLNAWLPGRALGGPVFVGVPLIIWIVLSLLSRMRLGDHTGPPGTRGRAALARVWRSRLVQLLLMLMFMTGATTIIGNVRMLSSASVPVTLLLVALTATHVSQRRLIAWDGLRHLFRRAGEGAAARTKMLRIVSATLVMCWAVALVVLHVVGARWQRLDTLATDPLSLYQPLPEATEETYERVIVASEPVTSAHPSDPGAGLPEHIAWAAPDDMAAFLAQRRAAGRTVSDRDLLRLLRKCGRDTRPVIFDALETPDALEALCARARWGDGEVKQLLEETFEEKYRELGEVYARMREDPNGLHALYMRARWGDKSVKDRLERIFEVGMAELAGPDRSMKSRDQVRSELETLLAVDEALLALGGPRHVVRFMRASHERWDRLERLLVDADMSGLEPSIVPPEVAPELLESLTEIAEALAFVSEPREAALRIRWLIAPLVDEWREARSLSRTANTSRSRRRGYGSDVSESLPPSLFYRVLRAVPPAQAGPLLKEYVGRRPVASPFEEDDFHKVVGRARDRQLSEWVFQKVAASPPSREVSDVPPWQPAHILDPQVTRRWEDASHLYLEAIFPHLTPESIPLLLDHLGSEHDQLRAFIVWCVASQAYRWSDDQLAPLLADRHWKVRLNALLACSDGRLEAMASDENSVVRVVAAALARSRSYAR